MILVSQENRHNPKCLKLIRVIYQSLIFLTMKNLKNLKGVKTLSKKEQQSINGGKKMCYWGPNGYYCIAPWVCVNGVCVLGPE
ncbi:MAG TPA: hypothetical protein DIW31_01200 [Bacteroidales bacterium]|nr:hypothetical protein [Bacteroidales bacterium]